MADLDALAQAAKDAIAASEERGFQRALDLIETKLRENSHLCIHFSSYGLPECTVKVEIEYEEDGRYIESPKVALSDLVYEQYPDCQGSVRDIAAAMRKSLVVVDHVIENWGSPAASEPPG